MSLTTITAAVADILAKAREAAAEAAGRSYGAERAYAQTLSATFADLSVAWFTIEHGAKGAEADLVHAEKAAYFKALHAKHPAGKYPNPSVPWARVRKYAQEEVLAAQRKAAAESGAELAEGAQEAAGSTGARHTRSLSLRMIEELGALFKAGRKAEKEGIIGKREAEALVGISAALSALGVDLGSL